MENRALYLINKQKQIIGHKISNPSGLLSSVTWYQIHSPFNDPMMTCGYVASHERHWNGDVQLSQRI